MKSTKILLVLALGIFLAVPAYGDKIDDPEPVNIHWASAWYDYRNYGTWSGTHEGGTEGGSGAYFGIYVGVVLRDFLEKYDDVMRVKARHLETGQRLFLIRGTCTREIDTDIQYWSLYIRPENWMFQGTWQFTMVYKGSDDRRHRQTAMKEMGPVAFPVKPSHIKIATEDSLFTLSWSAIGNPHTGPFDYRVRIFEEGCIVAQVNGDWQGGTGSYDAELNKVIFPIPLEWSGYQLRLENRIITPNQTSRACQYLQLPE